jgi:hypothetical protein
MDIILNALFILVLLLIYSILIYRIFIKRTYRWLRENIGLTVITILMALSSDYRIHIKSLIVLLSIGFLIILLYRKFISQENK